MKTSLVYVTVRTVIRHPDDVDPEDVLNNCDYEFTASETDKDCKVLGTELTEYDTRGECDEQGTLLADAEQDHKRCGHDGIDGPSWQPGQTPWEG